jgi:hypothetical protein
MPKPEEPTRRFDLRREPRGDDYRALIEYLASLSTAASLIIRPNEHTSEPAELASRVRMRRQVTQWPGTITLEPTSTMIEYALPDACKALKFAVDGLYEWLCPDRPEDLAMYRPDGTVVLLSCAHERFAELFLTGAEGRDLKNRLDEAWDRIGIVPRTRSSDAIDRFVMTNLCHFGGKPADHLLAILNDDDFALCARPSGRLELGDLIESLSRLVDLGLACFDYGTLPNTKSGDDSDVLREALAKPNMTVWFTATPFGYTWLRVHDK